MNAELLTRAPEAVVARNAEAAAKARLAERVAAFEFLLTGESEGPSPDGEPWSRDYDPKTDKWGEPPASAALYAGTGVGALYGLTKSRGHLWQLAGWNVVPRRIAYSNRPREDGEWEYDDTWEGA